MPALCFTVADKTGGELLKAQENPEVSANRMTRQSADFRLVQNQNDDTPRTAPGLSVLRTLAVFSSIAAWGTPIVN